MMALISTTDVMDERSPAVSVAGRGVDRPAEEQRGFIDVVLMALTALLYGAAHRLVFPWVAANWGDPAVIGGGGPGEFALGIGVWLSHHLWVFAVAFAIYLVPRLLWPRRAQLIAFVFLVPAAALMLSYVAFYAFDLGTPGGSV